MVGIFGVVDTDSSLVNVDSLNLTSVYDDIWATSVDGYGQQANDSNAVAGAADAADAPDMDTSQIHMSQALHVLNVCVLLLSSLGLFSTFLLIAGLIQKRRVFLLPWVCTVICTTGVDYVYAVYLLVNNLDFLNFMTAAVFAGDFLLVLINVYAIICVISQYQELHQEGSQQRTSLGIVDLRISEANQPMEEIKLGELSQHGRHSQSRHELMGTTMWIDG